jgi:hypothetical protein
MKKTFQLTCKRVSKTSLSTWENWFLESFELAASKNIVRLADSGEKLEPKRNVDF